MCVVDGKTWQEALGVVYDGMLFDWAHGRISGLQFYATLFLEVDICVNNYFIFYSCFKFNLPVYPKNTFCCAGKLKGMYTYFIGVWYWIMQRQQLCADG